MNTLSLHGERIAVTSLTADDVVEALEIYNSNPRYNQAILGKSVRSLSELRREYQEYAVIPTAHWLAIRCKGRLIGLSHLLVENPHDQKSWIGMFLLHSNWQRQGYGAEALAVIEAFVQGKGKAYLHTGVHAHDMASIHFFGACGYEQYRQVEANYGRLVHPVLLLVKPLEA